MKWLEFEDYVEVIVPSIGMNILLGFLFKDLKISLLIFLVSIFIAYSALKYRNYQYKKEIEREARREAEIERLKNKY